MSVRVRYAPSPTGMLHVGSLRDALFKYLFARGRGGTNILRIEDTDRSRYNAGSEREFIETLAWVGIDFDEGPHIGGPFGPYRQSERAALGLYEHAVNRLLAEGHAYKAFETPEELDEMRKLQEGAKEDIGYFGGAWRGASSAEVAQAEAEGKPFVIRQRIPRDTTIAIEDVIRGRVEWDSNTVDDPVLIKRDGMPTYHLASMVDDHIMEITHIMRGEEWLSSAPKHASLFDALGWERPIFVHLPVIVGDDNKKLSKRHGATRVLDYAAQGFLREALTNFMALVGWSPGGDQEILGKPALIEKFDLKGLQPSPGKFDLPKLKSLNGDWIRMLTPDELLDRLLAYVEMPYTSVYWRGEADPDDNWDREAGEKVLGGLRLVRKAAEQDREYVLAALKEVQPRIVTLSDLGGALEFFLVEEPPMDEKAVAKWLTEPHVPRMFGWICDHLSGSDEGSPDRYRRLLEACQAEFGFEKLGPVVHPTRVALTGKTAGPGLFELMSVLGRARIIQRLERVAETSPK